MRKISYRKMSIRSGNLPPSPSRPFIMLTHYKKGFGVLFFLEHLHFDRRQTIVPKE